MEEHKFNLCFKNSPNGRALSSHMKSNMLLSLQESESSSYSSYGVREAPKRSDSESSKNTTRRRSKRTWRTLEPVSSISDVAFCLMMLSRDHWKSKVHQDHDDDEETDESEYTTTLAAQGKYKCETCNKVFNSYQALGGHRASHKKIKASYETDSAPENVGTCSMTRKKTRSHECPVCFRVFSSGQALGGHKRSHIVTSQVAASGTTQTCVRSSKMLVLNLIDLNLPAPMDDYE